MHNLTPRTVMVAVRDVLTRSPATQSALRRAPFPQWVKRRIPPVGPHTLHTPAGQSFTYVADREDIMARGIVWNDLGSFERSWIEILLARFRSASRFWDIGAYAGIFSLLACAENPTIKVVAVEPVPSHARWLRRNVEVNGWNKRIEVVEAAVSDQEGTIDMTIVSDDITASGIGVDRSGFTIAVRTVRLDDLGQPPDIIKIDVEGYEVVALSTGIESLRARRPTIVTECLNYSALARMLDFLAPLGYELYHLRPGGPQRVIEPFNVPSVHVNFLAVDPSLGP